MFRLKPLIVVTKLVRLTTHLLMPPVKSIWLFFTGKLLHKKINFVYDQTKRNTVPKSHSCDE